MKKIIIVLAVVFSLVSCTPQNASLNDASETSSATSSFVVGGGDHGGGAGAYRPSSNG